LAESGLERLIRLNVLGLMWAFILVGTLFLLFPDGVVSFTNHVGSWFGDFSEGLVLAAGKFASSATGLLFYWFSLDAFGYLLNFLVDGAIVLNCVLLHRLLAPHNANMTARLLEPGGRARRTLRAALATLLALEEREEPSAGKVSDPLDAQLLRYLDEVSPQAPLALALALYAIEYGTVLWFGTLRPFTRLTPREREEYLGGFETSRFYLRQRLLFPVRLLGNALFYAEAEQAEATGYEFPSIDRSEAGAF
jgi:hypothetical protein